MAGTDRAGCSRYGRRVFWLRMASPNYSFQRTVIFSEIQSTLRLRTAITWETHAPLAMLNYSPL